MSIRDQERQARQAERRIYEAMRRADREVGQKITARAYEASRRAEEVKRRIERGDVQPRPLPGMREDSLKSMESMPSMKSSPSMESMESSDYVTQEVSQEAQQAAEAGEVMMKDMPLEGTGMDPADINTLDQLAGGRPRGPRTEGNRGYGFWGRSAPTRRAQSGGAVKGDDRGHGRRGRHERACRAQSRADERGDVRRRLKTEVPEL